jgi:hypothetical protein
MLPGTHFHKESEAYVSLCPPGSIKLLTILFQYSVNAKLSEQLARGIL